MYSLFKLIPTALKSSKGFLGPIGDDLPSLIPLVFALSVFFAAFTSTWTVFDTNSKAFDDNIAVLRIASIVKGNSYISDYEVFVERCEEAKSLRGIRFKAWLLPLETEEDKHFGGIEIVNPIPYVDPRDSDKIYFCTNATQKEIDIFKPQDIGPPPRFFPVALEMDYKESGERHFFVKPMLVVVIAW